MENPRQLPLKTAMEMSLGKLEKLEPSLNLELHLAESTDTQ